MLTLYNVSFYEECIGNHVILPGYDYSYRYFICKYFISTTNKAINIIIMPLMTKKIKKNVALLTKEKD